jgi:poly-beta-hydroxybutyrate-responsive repressor
MGKLSRLIEPVVLLVIRDNPDIHGYQLMNEMNKLVMTDSELDPGAIYRTLRVLEDAGMVVSHWDTTTAGPARRCYRLTEEGLQHLDDWAKLIEKRRSEMERFLKVYKREQ